MKRKLPFAHKILQHRWFPLGLQIGSALFFILILEQLLFGPAQAKRNFGSAATWLLWWPGLAVLFFLCGRFWCAVCPFAFWTDLTRRFFGNSLRTPAILKRWGGWLVLLLFLGLSWAEEVYHVISRPEATAVLLLTLITCVTASGVFFERRAWCRYLCPLGGVAGVYSRLALVELRASPARCRECTGMDCYKGGVRPGCPMFEVHRALDSNANCNFCGECIKNCPNGAIEFALRTPGTELCHITRPRLEEAVLIFVLLGLITCLNTMESAARRVYAVFPFADRAHDFTCFFLLCLLVTLGLGWIAARATSLLNQQSTRLNFVRFSYALLPAALAAHVVHTGSEFLENGKRPFAAAAALFVDNYTTAAPHALLGSGALLVFKIAVLTAGLAGSLYVLRAIAGNSRKGDEPPPRRLHWLPFAFLCLVFAAVNLLLSAAA